MSAAAEHCSGPGRGPDGQWDSQKLGCLFDVQRDHIVELQLIGYAMNLLERQSRPLPCNRVLKFMDVFNSYLNIEAVCAGKNQKKHKLVTRIIDEFEGEREKKKFKGDESRTIRHMIKTLHCISDRTPRRHDPLDPAEVSYNA